MNSSLLKMILFICLVCGFTYTVARLTYVVLRIRLSPIYLAIAPLLGLFILAIQLWVYGIAGISWDRWLLTLPWLVVGILLRKRLIASLVNEKQLIQRLPGHFQELDYPSRVMLILSLIISLAFLINLILEPFITSDILAIWGLKAKEFFQHSSVFISPHFTGTLGTARFFHVDYPPLLPLSANVFYVLLGHISETLFKAMQFIFITSGGSALYLFARSILSKNNKNIAALFLLLFIAVPQFLPMLFQIKYMGYADYPLAVTMMISAIFVIKSITSVPNSDWFLAVVFASFAAVIKNEGLPFFAIVLLVLAITFLSHFKKWKR